MRKQENVLKNLQILSVVNIFRIGILLLALWFLYFAVSTILNPYPIEYREGASQVLTELLLTGENPFSVSNQPLAMNNYGILYNLVIYPFAFLFGNTLAVYRSINLIILLMMFLMVLQTAYKNGSDRYIAMACGLIIAIVVPSWGGFGAYPSVMGTLLFISAVLIPFHFSFTLKSLWVSAFLAVLAYFTKPYFVLSFGIVSSYIFLFVSKRKGLLYGLIFGLIFTTFYLFVRLVFEFYFIDTFWGNIANATSRSFAHMRKQLFELMKEFVLVITLAVWIAIDNIRKFQKPVFSNKTALFQISLQNFTQPLFLHPLNYFVFWGIFSTLAFFFILGVHDGAYMTYAYQIMLTPLLLWFAQSVDLRIYKDKIVLPLILLNIITLSYTFLNINFLSQKDSPEWAELYQYIADSDISNILNSPVVVSALLERNIMPVDSGQTEYYYAIRDPYPPSMLLGPEYNVFRMRGVEYIERVSQMIKDKHYDRLLITQNRYLDDAFTPHIINNYILVDEITVSMPQVDQIWTIEVWEPMK